MKTAVTLPSREARERVPEGRVRASETEFLTIRYPLITIRFRFRPHATAAVTGTYAIGACAGVS